MVNDAGWSSPPYWDDERLEGDRAEAIAGFVHQRMEEGPAAYSLQYASLRPAVVALFSSTQNLTDFSAISFANTTSTAAARHLAAPPVSADDLKVLVDVLVGEGEGVTPHDAMAEVVLAALDPVRIPWLREGRIPDGDEVECAIDWTTGVWAAERVRTDRRMGPSKQQEEAVAAALVAAGYTEVPRPGAINVLDALARGTFCREEVVAGAKADVPVRLRDGRLLAIECKVTNSYLNSVKRLLRETGGKSATWQAAFGRQVVTAGVLAGVFKLKHLQEAQDRYRITLFWEHDLAPLAEFVSSAT